MAILEARIRGIYYRADLNHWTYPQIINALAQAGVRRCEVDLSSRHMIFYALSDRIILTDNTDVMIHPSYLHTFLTKDINSYHINFSSLEIRFFKSPMQEVDRIKLSKIFPPTVLALMSDRTIDFTPQDFSLPLNDEQRAYIVQRTGKRIEQVIWCKQVHGDTIAIVDENWRRTPLLEADAFVTQLKNTPIAIRTADCVPVFIYDPQHEAIGLVHAGWKGTSLQITRKTVELMQRIYGSHPSEIIVSIGASSGVCCYEVGAEFKNIFPLDILERDGKIYADIAQQNIRQLLSLGVLEKHVTRNTECTICHTHYHSYRRDGQQSGRMVSIMSMEESL